VSNTLQRFGAAFGIAIVTALFTASGHLGSAAGVTSGYRPALAVSAAISRLGAFTALGVGGRRRRSAVARASAAVPASAARPAVDVDADNVPARPHR